MTRQSFSIGIRTRLFLLSIIPVMIVTGVITWHTIDTRRTEVENNLAKQTRLTVEYLASISDFALYTGRKDLLRSLAITAEKTPPVRAVVYLDQNRDILYASEPLDRAAVGAYKRGDYSGLGDNLLVAELPVHLNSIEVADYETEQPAASDSPLLGWVVISTDRSAMESLSEEILSTHLLISLVVLAGAALLTYVLSNAVVQPITAMTRTVRELEQGNLYTQLETRSNDELAILAQGINHLAMTVAESRQNLQRKVFDATHRLQSILDDLQQKNQELDIARQEAEAANQAKTDFLAQMSHELRTPITAIQGFVRLLGESHLNPGEKRYCDIIQQASLQLLQLIDDILDITRLQSSGIVLETAPFNLMDCVEIPLSLMAPSAHQKGLELILDVAPDVPRAVIGDNLRIRQIVYNLVSNAIKFTSSGEVIVRVNTRDEAPGETRLLIQVIDTGIGIPEKQRAQIFEPFSQADNSISRRFGGSGLGLTIVRNLVMLMGGTISLDSMAGKGSTFSVELPLPVAALHQHAQSRYHNVLLFDPHPHSRQALERLLANFVDNIESCESTTDLEIAGGVQAPDIILYSVPVNQMPGTLDHHINYLRDRFGCPILIVSPLNNFTAPPHGGDGRQVLFIDKPPTFKELAAVFTEPDGSGAGKPVGADASLPASILIAEDNEFNRLLLSTFLDKLGSDFTTAANGQQAIALCDRQRFDLILMDVHMPEVNGISAVKAIRSGHGPNRDTPIVMLTADILQQEENALFDAGANDLLFKPFDEAKLTATLRGHLRMPASAVGTEQERPVQAPPTVDLGLFVQEVSKLTRVAQQAIEDRDAPNLRESIHQLLGIAGVFKMTYLERAVRALHGAVREEDEEKTHAAMVTLAMEVEQLRRMIEG
ncbi:MAG: ATP-binding protein [Porticoccaceae bacterium]|nr:ATP-binding protein [Porticoccaceae bacterium]MEA3299376.1 ATP-binding protein [Pseudomonadota bacterium]HLS99351.1 ATP-binding protein [Porticoccaceae bacterium]